MHNSQLTAKLRIFCHISMIKHPKIVKKVCAATFELRSKALPFEKNKKILFFFGFLLTYSYLCSRFYEIRA